MNQIAVFDIEAINFMKPFLIGFFDGENYIVFEGEQCIKEFCEFLLKKIKKYSKYKIYSHYGGGYDFQFLIEYFAQHGYKLNILYNNSQIFYFSVERNKRYLKFYDSFALLPLSLEELTKHFNVEHKKIPINREKIYEIYQENRDLVLEYLKHDCLGLYEVLTEFYNIIEELGGQVRKTLASTSYSILKTYLEKQNIKYPTIRRFRECYYGGRTEIFIRYGKDLYYYDFNSLYPSVMRDFPYPISKPMKEKPEYMEDYECGFVLANVKIKECEIPPIPLRINNKLVFPIGKFTTWITLPEFKYALKKDLIEYYEIFELYIFESEYIFKDFVDDLYKRRIEAKKEGNKALDLIFKLLLNSSYGKFGEKEEKERIKLLTEDEHELLFNHQLYHDSGLIKIKETIKLKHINVAIASHITCYARLRLLDKMYDILENGGKVWYCDTDSIVTNLKLPNSNQLGELKLEYEIEEGIFLLPKVYGLKLKNGEEIVKVKGFPKVFTYNDLKNALFNKKELKTKIEKFGKLKESLRRFSKFYTWLEMEKMIKAQYDKRIIVNNIYTKPLTINL